VKRIAPTPQSNLPTLQAAVLEIFHAVCPHPTRYMTQDRLNLDEDKADLAIWMAEVTTVWIHLKDTQHHSDCLCCITFRRLATNYENMLKQAMSNYEYEEKRVLVNDIRWVADVQGSSAKEALSNLKRVARATLTGEDDSCISEMTDDSSNISSASASDTTSVISTQPSITLVHEQEEQSTQSSDEEEEKETLITSNRRSVVKSVDYDMNKCTCEIERNKATVRQKEVTHLDECYSYSEIEQIRFYILT
jgi:hypothetical protein